MPFHRYRIRQTPNEDSHVTIRKLAQQKYLTWPPSSRPFHVEPSFLPPLCPSSNSVFFFWIRFSFAFLFGPKIGAVASRAILGCGLVKQDQFALDFPFQGVALGATNVRVRARQGELGALIMIKGGGDPVLDRVAIRAQRHFVFRGKLLAMRVVVAPFAILGGAFELCFL